MSAFGLLAFANPNFFRMPFKIFIIVVLFVRLAERDVTRTTFKCCRNFCSFVSKWIVTANVISPWCTDLQQGMLLDLWCSASFLFQTYCKNLEVVRAAAIVILNLKCGNDESEKCFIARYPFVNQNCLSKSGRT